MVSTIIEACAKNRILVFLAVLFATLASLYCIHRVKLDAIPDLSHPQAIIFTEWKGRSPNLVEDQVTYPIVSKLLGAPRVTDVRGYSMFGMSFIYVLFEDGTDLYWARSRVLEYLSGLERTLPEEASPVLGPDATGVGWVFQYTLVDAKRRLGLEELRTLQDFTLRQAIGAVPGVAEVASVGGYEKQYQITVDPVALRANGLTLDQVAEAIRDSNLDVGGRLIEMSGREYYVRGRGYVQSLDEVERVAIAARGEGGAPLLVRDIGKVSFGPELRRGLLEWNGEGEAVGGIVVMRHGENALEVIERVKARIAELTPGLPEGVSIEVAYDRSALIERSIDTLKRTLIEEAIVVSLIVLLFLFHLRASLLPILSLPVAVSLSFIPMFLLDIPSTIMSLGGIAIAIGATVDAEIVMIEASLKRLEHAPPGADRRRILASAAREVTPAIFFSLLIIAVSFLPVFTLTGEAGRLFRPLAFTKTFVMLAAALLSITFAPALRDLLLRGKVRPEARHPVSRFIIKLYRPFVYVALRRPKSTLAIGLFAIVSAIPLAKQLGHEFMPPLNEGDILYMPTTFPNLPIEDARQQLQAQDRILMRFPEVASVFGKVGRAETATDPAPLTMVETLIRLKPRAEWRKMPRERWFSGWAPNFIATPLSLLWPVETTITWEELTGEMNQAMQFPGWTNSWTMPIKTRIDMLTTGVKTPVGIKIFGNDLEQIEEVGIGLEKILAGVPGTRSAFYERSLGGLYVDILPDREELARHGLTVGAFQRIVEASVGGLHLGSTVEGRNRFTINIRYPQALRDDVEQLRLMPALLPAGEGEVSLSLPLGQLAKVAIASGPPMIRDEDGFLAGYLYADIDQGRYDIGGYVKAARAAVDDAIARGALTLPTGSYLKWTGEYELMEEMAARMRIALPATLLIVIILLFIYFRSIIEVLIVMLSIPFALVGSIWLLWLLDYRLSTAVWVGIIALVGLAAQTGIVMIVYIDNAFHKRKAEGRIRDLNDIIWAHLEGTVQRVRPKLMTVLSMFVGLVPLLWATGSGADVMKRVAAPMIGGLATSAFLTLELIPVIYTYWRQEELLWERLADLDQRALRWLKLSSACLSTGLAVVIGMGVLHFYVPLEKPALLSCISLGAIMAVAGSVLYLIERPAARRLVWP